MDPLEDEQVRVGVQSVCGQRLEIAVVSAELFRLRLEIFDVKGELAVGGWCEFSVAYDLCSGAAASRFNLSPDEVRPGGYVDWGYAGDEVWLVPNRDDAGMDWCRLTAADIHRMYYVLEQAFSSHDLDERADVRDGLTSRERRVLLAVDDLVGPHNKPITSSRVVERSSPVLNPFAAAHTYETLLALANPDRRPYPLLETFGSVNWQDQWAASPTNTQCRVSTVGTLVLTDLWQEGVAAPFPMLCVNGGPGVPPHNLDEVIAAALHLVDDPHCSDEALLGLIGGPDYPTGGVIIDNEELWRLYVEGKGAVVLRARHHWLQSDQERSLLLSELPPGVTTGAVESAIRHLVTAGELAGVIDVEDRSYGTTITLVLSLGEDIDEGRVLTRLWAATPLQVVERFNNNEPLLSLLRQWVTFEVGRASLLGPDVMTAPERLKLSLAALAERYGRPRKSTLSN